MEGGSVDYNVNVFGTKTVAPANPCHPRESSQNERAVFHSVQRLSSPASAGPHSCSRLATGIAVAGERSCLFQELMGPFLTGLAFLSYFAIGPYLSLHGAP